MEREHFYLERERLFKQHNMLGAYKKHSKGVPTTRGGEVQEMYRGVYQKMKGFKGVEDKEVI